MAKLETTTISKMYGYCEDANGAALVPAKPKMQAALQGLMDKYADEVYQTAEANTDHLQVEIEGQQFILSHSTKKTYSNPTGIWHLVKVQPVQTNAAEQQARLARMFGK